MCVCVCVCEKSAFQGPDGPPHSQVQVDVRCCCCILLGSKRWRKEVARRSRQHARSRRSRQHARPCTYMPAGRAVICASTRAACRSPRKDLQLPRLAKLPRKLPRAPKDQPPGRRLGIIYCFGLVTAVTGNHVHGEMTTSPSTWLSVTICFGHCCHQDACRCSSNANPSMIGWHSSCAGIPHGGSISGRFWAARWGGRHMAKGDDTFPVAGCAAHASHAATVEA